MPALGVTLFDFHKGLGAISSVPPQFLRPLPLLLSVAYVSAAACMSLMLQNKVGQITIIAVISSDDLHSVRMKNVQLIFL